MKELNFSEILDNYDKKQEMSQFIKRQIKQIKHGGINELIRKIKLLFEIIRKLSPYYILAIIPAIPAVLIMRLMKPWFLVRLGVLISSRIGHFALNTEIYLCERDAGINLPNQRHIDIFYLNGKICNQQLLMMWQRLLCVWPAWVLAPTDMLNRLFPGGKSHVIGNNTQYDRDVNNLLNQIPPHLKFTSEEEIRGEEGLRKMGIPIGAKFVCLIGRDSSYLSSYLPNHKFEYHNYRDSDIQNFVLAAKTLADRGIYLIRMGAKVNEALNTTHPKVIDYASNGMRSDFMDIYLAAKSMFCLSACAGFESVPAIFRRPIARVNMVPIGYLTTFFDRSLSIFKHHFDNEKNYKLTLSEIFNRDLGHSLAFSCFESKGVNLIENTPEEIRDLALEMFERLEFTWQSHTDDEKLQRRFWKLFPTDTLGKNGNQLHGIIFDRIGSKFLRSNLEWLK